MVTDLTIVYLTANLLKDEWTEYQRGVLLEAANGRPIISVSREPIKLGMNIIDTEPRGISNIYFQLLRACKLADSHYIGVAEDDTLYVAEHFDYRPTDDTFAYNKNRFNLFAWSRKPTYFFKDRFSNSTLIAPRQLLIEALEERFTKWPNGTPENHTGELGRRIIENQLGVTHRKAQWFETEYSIIRVDHEQGVDRLSRSHRKGYGPLKAYDIPYWGKAEDIIKKFK